MQYPAIKSTATQADTRPHVQLFLGRHGLGRFPDAGDQLYLLTESCQSTLSEAGLLQSAVCDVPPYSFTETGVYAGRTL